MAPRTGLFKQDANTTLHIGESGTFAVIKVVVAFLRKIQRANLIQVFGMVLANFDGQLLVLFGRDGIHSGTYPWHKEERGVGTHFVVIGQDVGFPFMENFGTAT